MVIIVNPNNPYNPTNLWIKTTHRHVLAPQGITFAARKKQLTNSFTKTFES